MVGSDWFGWFADAYRVQDAAWIEAIRNGTTIGPSAWDGLVAQLVVHAALASLDQDGAVVDVELPERPALYGDPRNGLSPAR
jgi:myo-inositol 2-dehydrogenase/D-chiro-inositol 1-dehydrogenase